MPKLNINKPNNINTIFPPETLVYILGFLPSLNNAKLVCKFWNTLAKDTEIGKKQKATIAKNATKALIHAALNGNVEQVKHCLQNGANVNVQFSFQTQAFLSIYSFQLSNLLHGIIQNTKGSLSNTFNIGMASYVEIFKILLQHNIDINHTVNYRVLTSTPYRSPMGRCEVSLQSDKTIHKEKPIESLNENFSNNEFRALLLLRNAELVFEKNRDIEKLITQFVSISDFSKQIVKNYLQDISSKRKSLVYTFSQEEKEVLSVDPRIISITSNLSINNCTIS